MLLRPGRMPPATFTPPQALPDGVMKATNFSAPKHGAVTCLTLDELKAVAAHWKVDIQLV